MSIPDQEFYVVRDKCEQFREALNHVLGICRVQSERVGNMHKVEAIEKIAERALKNG